MEINEQIISPNYWNNLINTSTSVYCENYFDMGFNTPFFLCIQNSIVPKLLWNLVLLR